MDRRTEDYKQQLFEAAAEYGKAGRAAYQELEAHIDEAVDNGSKPREIVNELGEPEQAIRKIIKADGKTTYPFSKIFWSGILIALGLGIVAGLSGLLMPIGSHLAGMRAISGDPDVLPYTAARCAQYLEHLPNSTDCRQAAMLDHYYELTNQRVIFALLCVICFVLLWLTIRRGVVHILPRKTILLLGAAIYIAVGSIVMVLALADLSAGRTWDWLGDFITGIPMFVAGLLLLAYYLGYISRPRAKNN